jgi:hypothetical protein
MNNDVIDLFGSLATSLEEKSRIMCQEIIESNNDRYVLEFVNTYEEYRDAYLKALMQVVTENNDIINVIDGIKTITIDFMNDVGNEIYYLPVTYQIEVEPLFNYMKAAVEYVVNELDKVKREVCA